MDETKLKPCPFCGSKAVLTHVPPDGTPYRMGDDGLYIVCCYDDECGAGKSGSNLDDVIKEWNTRPLEDALQAEIERLREAQRWQPMETAPKDGTHILVYDKDSVEKVSWERDIVYYPGGTKNAPLRWCIYGTLDGEQGGYMTIDEPLGWMPLPQPPQEA